MRKVAPLLCYAVVFAAGMAVHAERPPLVVSRVFGQASAARATALPAGASFSTTARSKSELATEHGLVRVGENAQLHAESAGLSLQRGVTLVSSKPEGLRKTIELRAAGYRFKVRGTAQVAFDPRHSLKVAVLEGKITVYLDSVTGEFEELTPGQMLIIDPSNRRLPEPVEVDIDRLANTSALVHGEFGALPSEGRIKSAIAAQSVDFRRGELAETNFLLRGVENAVEVRRAPGDLQRNDSRPETRPPVETTIFNAENDLSQPGKVRERIFTFSNNVSRIDTLSDQTIAPDEFNPGRTQILDVELTQHLTSVRGSKPIVDGSPQIRGNVTVDPDFFFGGSKTLQFMVVDRAPGFDRLAVAPGANVSTPAHVTLAFDARFGLDVDGARLTAGLAKAPSEALALSAAEGGISITNNSALLGGSVTIAGGSAPAGIVANKSTITAQGRLKFGADTSPTSIRIGNSSELQSLVYNLEILTDRAAISVEENSKISAKKRLTIDASGRNAKAADGLPLSTPGVVGLTNAHLTAASIRVRGFAQGADSLVVDGSTLNATQLIELYGAGVSTLRFRNSVSLNTPLALLIGKTVEVDPGGAVNISGKGRVYTDTDNYNKSCFGTIQAKGGLGQHGFQSKPGF